MSQLELDMAFQIQIKEQFKRASNSAISFWLNTHAQQHLKQIIFQNNNTEIENGMKYANWKAVDMPVDRMFGMIKQAYPITF